ncbi:IS5 family transposase [Streptomyces monashensis]|uniref:IS5 family transposase n=1 Tax=Streptomyces monashensis TaxID=1678012 RepID=UPI0033D8C5AF
MEDSLHPLPPLRPGRRVHPSSPGDPGPSGRGRRHRPARPDRLHHRRAPQHAAATGQKKGGYRPDEPDDHTPGRSRGGLTTKIHLARDGKGCTLAILPTPRQHHDSICARPLLERIRVPRISPGRPRSTPDQVITDQAHSSRGSRAYLRRRGIACTIPEKADQHRHRHKHGRRSRRPPAYDPQIQRRRNAVERCFNRPKGFHSIATRDDKTATDYEAAASLASFPL